MNQEGFAVITGASRGLGMAFARELADRQHNLVLVARSIESLQALASELRKSNPITVVVCEIDLCRPWCRTTIGCAACLPRGSYRSAGQ